MGKEDTCCFTGHRNIPADQLPVVSAKLRVKYYRSFQRDTLILSVVLPLAPT